MQNFSWVLFVIQEEEEENSLKMQALARPQMNTIGKIFVEHGVNEIEAGPLMTIDSPLDKESLRQISLNQSFKDYLTKGASVPFLLNLPNGERLRILPDGEIENA